MVARMEYSAEGKPGPAAFSAAVIKSKARLTYSQVGRIVLDKDEEERKKVAHVLPMLEEAYRITSYNVCYTKLLRCRVTRAETVLASNCRKTIVPCSRGTCAARTSRAAARASRQKATRARP